MSNILGLLIFAVLWYFFGIVAALLYAIWWELHNQSGCEL